MEEEYNKTIKLLKLHKKILLEYIYWNINNNNI